MNKDKNFKGILATLKDPAFQNAMNNKKNSFIWNGPKYAMVRDESHEECVPVNKKKIHRSIEEPFEPSW